MLLQLQSVSTDGIVFCKAVEAGRQAPLLVLVWFCCSWVYYGKPGWFPSLLYNKRGVGSCIPLYCWCDVDIAGITGIALTIGMVVVCNIIIYELEGHVWARMLVLYGGFDKALLAVWMASLHLLLGLLYAMVQVRLRDLQ